MPIVDARALTYQQMVSVSKNQPIQLNGESAQPYDVVRVISITDKDLPKIFTDSDDVVTLVFADIEPNGFETPSFIPPSDSDFMKEEDSVKVVDFIEKIHAMPEKVLLLVNCKHGMCRSGAVVDYAATVCSLGYWNNRRRNPQIVPNHWVSYMLFKEHFKRKMSK